MTIKEIITSWCGFQLQEIKYLAFRVNW